MWPFIRTSLLALAGVVVSSTCVYFLLFQEYYRLPPVSFVEVDATPTTLIDGMPSYQTVSRLEQTLEAKSPRLDIKREVNPEPGGERPPFKIETLKIANYQHLGFGGQLVLTFFNNRLMEARFFPFDFTAYLNRLNREDGLDLHTADGITRLPSTFITLGEESERR